MVLIYLVKDGGLGFRKWIMKLHDDLFKLVHLFLR